MIFLSIAHRTYAALYIILGIFVACYHHQKKKNEAERKKIYQK